MQRNSKKPGKYFYKNMNAQSVQINAAAGERFETQNRNNPTVQNSTYKDITLNKTQSEEHRNEETQQHQDIENRSINTIQNHLNEFHQKRQENFTQIKNFIYHIIRINSFKNGTEIPLSQLVI